MIYREVFKIVASDKDDNVVCCGKQMMSRFLRKFTTN